MIQKMRLRESHATPYSLPLCNVTSPGRAQYGYSNVQVLVFGSMDHASVCPLPVAPFGDGFTSGLPLFTVQSPPKVYHLPVSVLIPTLSCLHPGPSLQAVPPGMSE